MHSREGASRLAAAAHASEVQPRGQATRPARSAPLPSRASSTTRLRGALSLVVALVVGAGCASSQAPVPGAGHLEVVNPGEHLVGVLVDGRDEGVVQPRSRHLVRYLPTGTRRVVFNVPGMDPDVHALTIDANATTTWVVADPGGAPLPPPLASLAATNALSQPVLVRADGKTLGRILAGETRTFVGLVAGAVRAEALPDGSGTVVTGDLVLVPGSETTWTVAAVGTSVDVDNTTTEAIFVSVDGSLVGRVGPGDKRTFVVSTGLHAFGAVSEPSRRRYETDIDTRPEAGDTRHVWTVAQGSASVSVTNGTRDALTISLAGAERGTLAPDESLSIKDLPSGTVTIRARAENGQLHVASYNLAAGDAVEWRVQPTAPSVRISNTSERPLVLYGGTQPGALELLGDIGPTSAVTVNGLKPATYHFEAFDIAGAQRFETTLDLKASGAGAWQIRSESGVARITNRKRERVTIRIDGGDFATLAPDETRIATGLAPGPHLVEAVGATSGARRSETIRVTAEETHDVVFGDSIATVTATNAAGEKLFPLGPIRSQRDSVAANNSATFILAPGRHTLRFLGADSGAVFDAPIVLTDGAKEAITIRQTPARLKFTNGLAEAVAVSRNGQVIAGVDPGATATLDDLRPGRCELQIVGLTSGRFRTLRAVLPPGGTEHLRIDPVAAVLLVENRTTESADVYVGDTLLGTANGGTIAAFGHLAAGEHKVQVVFRGTVQRVVQSVTLDEGERRLLVAELPAGSVLVENASLESLTVSIDGRVASQIPADATRTWLAVPAGSHRVDIAYGDSGLSDTFQLDVNPDSATQLSAQPRRARLVLVNQHDKALEVRNGDHTLATVEAGHSIMLEDLRPGTLEMRAWTATGQVTHRGRLTLLPGQTGTWVMVPLPLPPAEP